ncbi:GAF domain-containing protein [Azospirillum sp. sgz302134]
MSQLGQPHTSTIRDPIRQGHIRQGPIRSDQLLDAAPSPEQLLHQQAVLADFGRKALVETDLDRILADAARLCAEGAQVPYTKILELLPGGRELLVRAGHGWFPGVVGRVRAPVEESNPCGIVLLEERPVVDIQVQSNAAYHLPGIYGEYGIISTVNVVIMTDQGPYGVLEVDVDEERAFTIADVTFLTSFANLLGDAVVRSRRDRAAERQRLLLGLVRRRVRDGAKADAATLAAHIDRLLAPEMDGTTALGDHLAQLCGSVAGIERADAHRITVECETPPLSLAADRVLALGVALDALLSGAVRRAIRDGAEGAVSMRLLRLGSHRVRVAVEAPVPIAPDGLADIRRLLELAQGALEANGGTNATVTLDI